MATPAPSLSPDLLKRLIYSKYLLRRAASLQREGNELATAEAVLVLHDAAEMLMRVVAEAVRAKPPDRFMEFWKNLSDKTRTAPPHRVAMERLNNLRVGFKHLGNLPNPAVVADLLPVVTAFCHEIASLYLKLDFEAVSVADLIPNAEARAKVKEAEAIFGNGEAQDAFAALGIAYDKLRSDARNKLGVAVSQHESERWDSPFCYAWPRNMRDSIEALQLDKMGAHIQALIDTVNILLLGISPQKLRKFEKLTPERFYNPGGDLCATSWRFGTRPPLDAEAFSFLPRLCN